MSFSDIIPIMQAAGASPSGIRYLLPTFGLAVNFRQRCYRYRKSLVKTDIAIPGYVPSTPYDNLTITLEDEGGNALLRRPEVDGPTYVVIKEHKPVGELFDGDGNPLSIPKEDDLGLDVN